MNKIADYFKTVYGQKIFDMLIMENKKTNKRSEIDNNKSLKIKLV